MLSKEDKKQHYIQEKNFYLRNYWRDGNNKTDIYRPNGFPRLPVDTYLAFCEQIDRNGKMLDLGCGNGLMLKYLIQTTQYKLIPFGIDFMKKSIEQAKKIIHPQYAQNFVFGNLINYDLYFKKTKFDFIFTFLSHLYPADRKILLKKIRKSCRKGGKIIFYEYSDVIKALHYSWVGQFPELKNWRLTRKDYPQVSVGIWKNQE